MAPKKDKEKKPVTALVAKEERALSPQNLISQAITQGANIETMSKLMDLQDRWDAKQAKKAFDAAMAAFQAECPIIKKTRPVKDNSGKVLYYFAPIETIVAQVAPYLKKHGFSYSIKTKTTGGLLTATCIARHELGHQEESDFEVPSTSGTSIMSGPQKAAAALTFAKRYAFCNTFGIMTGDGDPDATKGATEGPSHDAVTDEQILQSTRELIGKTKNVSTLEQFAKKARSNKDLSPQALEEILNLIDEKIILLKTNGGIR